MIRTREVFDLHPPLSDTLSSGSRPSLFLVYELWDVRSVESSFTLCVPTGIMFMVTHAT